MGLYIPFPRNPTLNQEFTFGSFAFKWDGTRWVQIPSEEEATGGAGAQGVQGTLGSGTQGVQGTLGTGTQGSQGIFGAQGAQGIIGSQGSQGLQGLQGLQGIQGLVGTGVQGVQGAAGTGGAGGSANLIASLGSTVVNYIVGVASYGAAAGANVNTSVYFANANLYAGNVIVSPSTIGPANGIYSLGDLTVARVNNGQPERGAVYFGNSGATYLYFDGTQWSFGASGNTANVVIRGGVSAGGVHILPALNTASNVTRVSANTGSTQSNVGINFNNSSTLTVAVAPGTPGNANVEFTVTGISGYSGTYWTSSNDGAGSGLDADLLDGVNGAVYYSAANSAANLARVSANTGSTQHNVALNFNNTATINVSVGSGTAGNANIAFSVNATATLNSSGNVRFSGNIYDTPILSISGSASYSGNAAGKVIVVDSASAATVTFDTADAAGFAITVLRKGAGDVLISNTTALLKLNSANFTTSNIYTRYGAATVIYTATNEIVLIGDIL